MRNRFLLLAIGVVAVITFSIAATHSSAQLKSVGKRFPASKLRSINQIDHTPFDEILRKYVNKDGEVNYAGLKATASDRQQLQQYLASLSQANPDLQASKSAKLAYWINAYNAVTLEGILEVYPTSSIRNHTKKLGYNMWTDLKLIVADFETNLEDIEHKVLRKMNEPRIHFAIVCASTGCPRLLNQAYVADKLEQQLRTNTTDFFARSRNLNFDASKNQLQLSAILDWFGTDFGPDQTAQLRKLFPYFPESVQKIIQKGGYRVSYQDYDWSLNEQK